MDRFLERRGSSGMGLLGCELAVRGRECLPGATVLDILYWEGIRGRAPRGQLRSVINLDIPKSRYRGLGSEFL